MRRRGRILLEWGGWGWGVVVRMREEDWGG